jgi:hypothetical protein
MISGDHLVIKMKQKSFFVGLTIAAIGLLIFSMVAIAKVVNANPHNLATNLQPQAAQFLPRRSPLVASFLVNPDQLTLAAKLATKPSDRRSLNQEITNLKTQLKQTWALDYDQDLKPWLGSEVTLAVTTTDLDRDPNNGSQAGYLIAFATERPSLAQKYLDKFWQTQAQAGADLAFEQYQGVSLISTKTPNGGSSKSKSIEAIANARIGKFILFANDPSVIRNAINNLQAPSLALANNPDYLNSLKQFTDQGFALAYINPKEIKGLFAKVGVENSEILTANFNDSIPTALTLGFRTNDLGIEAETILAVNAASDIALSQTSAGIDILKYISGGSSLIVGNDLAKTFGYIFSLDLQINPALQQAIAKLEQTLDFTLSSESVNWITDQYAIALSPSIDPDLDPDLKNKQSQNWLLIAENKNPEKVKAAITQLDQDARTKSKFTVGEITIKDQPLTLWTKLNPIEASKTVTGKVALVHTEIATKTNNYVLISDSIATIETALTSSSILDSDPVFKTIASTIGTKNGLVYLNAQDLHSLITLKPPLKFFQNRLQSLAIGNTEIASSAETTFLHGQMILNWQRN